MKFGRPDRRRTPLVAGVLASAVLLAVALERSSHHLLISTSSTASVSSRGKRGLPAAREEQQGHLSALAEAGAAGSDSSGGSEAAGAGGGDSGGVGELGNGGKSVSGHQQEQQQQQGSEAGGGSMGAEGQEDKGEAGPGAGSQPSNQQEAERRREERRQAIEEAAGSEQQQQQQLVQGKGDDKQEGQGGGTSSSSSGAAGGSSESGSSSSSSERCPPLSKKLLEGLARNGTIMYSLLNSAQHDFFRNWLHHLRGVGVSYFVVGAVDANTSSLLAREKVPCFEYIDEAAKLEIFPNQTFEGRGHFGWHRTCMLKIHALDEIVSWGFNIIHSDMDVIWMRDPLPLFDKHPHAEALFSTDVVSTSLQPGDDGLEANGNMWFNYNSGVYLLRNTPNATRWVHAWKGVFDVNGGPHPGPDQEGNYHYTRVGDVVPHPQDPRVTSAWNGSLWLGILPPQVFSSAHSYGVQRLHEHMGLQPYAMHLTWTYNGADGKRARARDLMLWHDGSSYYSQGNFLAIDWRPPRVPEGYTNKTENEEMISYHLLALQEQLHQAYVGAGLAAAAGRAFISPKFQCFCEKIWYAVIKCRMWDAQQLPLPFQCPSDYIWRPDRFADNPGEFGPPFQWREPSFLDNPRTPDAVKKSVLVIEPGSDMVDCGANCTEERKEGEQLVVRVPPSLLDSQLLPLLEKYRQYRVWVLRFGAVNQPKEAFGGFECKGAAERFDRRMDRALTDWCCRSNEEAEKYNKPTAEQLRFNLIYSKRPGLNETC